MSCPLMLPAAGADLAARSRGAHQCVRCRPAVVVICGLPEGVVPLKDILERMVLCLEGSSRRLVPYHVAAGLVGLVWLYAHCAACAAPHSVHEAFRTQASRPVRTTAALGAAWVPLGRRSA